MGASVNIIREDSLRAVEDGYAFDVRLNWYRSLPLSCIHVNSIKIDGEPAAPDQILFEINDRQYSLAELADRFEEFWFVQDFAGLHVQQPGKLQPGETHTLEAEITLRFPYMQIGPGKFLTITTRQASTQLAK